MKLCWDVSGIITCYRNTLDTINVLAQLSSDIPLCYVLLIAELQSAIVTYVRDNVNGQYDIKGTEDLSGICC